MEEPLQQKARQMPGFSIFGNVIFLNIANRISATNTAFNDDRYLDLRQSLR